MALNRWLTDEEYARAAANGINRKRLYSRVYDFDWDVEEAITAPIGTVRHEYERKHGDWFKVALENGINDICFYKRVERGMHPYLAATKPKDKRGSTKKKQIS